MMKLHYLPGACSFVPHTALEWIGQPYEGRAVTLAEMKSPEYLALNPLGAVPLLQDGELTLTQNMAIAYYLDAKFPQARLFGSDDIAEKAKALRWFAFFNADAHKAFNPLFAAPAYAKDNEALVAQIRADAIEKIHHFFSIANAHLTKNKFFGADISLADVYLYTMIGWTKWLNVDISSFSEFPDFIARVEANAGVDRVRTQQGLKQ